MNNQLTVNQYSLNAAVAKRINELLKEKGLTQYRFSRMTGISEATICGIRLQRNETVKLSVIYAIARGFNMELSEFFSAPYFKEVTD